MQNGPRDPSCPWGQNTDLGRSPSWEAPEASPPPSHPVDGPRPEPGQEENQVGAREGREAGPAQAGTSGHRLRKEAQESQI